MRCRSGKARWRTKKKSATSASSRSAAQAARAGRSANRTRRVGAPLARVKWERERLTLGSPRPAVSIGSCRCLPDSSEPAPPDRNRWPRGPSSRARENAQSGLTRRLVRADSRSGRARPIPKSNRVRAHPKASLRPAIASGCCRRAPPPCVRSGISGWVIGLLIQILLNTPRRLQRTNRL